MRFLPVVFSFLIFFSCQLKEKQHVLFELISPEASGIDFQNRLIENEEFNIVEYLYYYNGGGVAIGDINNDGLSDIYLSANQQANKLYLNKGNFTFEDITDNAGVAALGNWKTGVSMIDVNADGWLDIYVCGVGSYKSFNGYNQLFINNGDLTFTERAKEFGLFFKGFSTQATFFDYDLDGDVDMYLANHSVHSQRTYGKLSLRYESDSLAGDRLYQNEFSQTGKTFFTDVTKSAGILSSQVGYGLSVGISDLNRDGYPDIYVSNDFNENDYVYINQQDGSFSQQSEVSLNHSSRFSMGNDVGDFNNDLWPDIVSLDMLPQDESVIKTSAGEDSYEVYNFKLKSGYGRQVSRNALQLSRGVNADQLLFTDIAPFAGVEATDWSWCPLLVDFDGDGWKDLFISNGIERRPNDLDYINFISDDSVQHVAQKDPLYLVRGMPEGKVSNFLYHNNGDLTFSDSTTAYGLSVEGISNGAAYADLDNDGDPDLVVNQLNANVLIYRNNSPASNFVKVKLQGDSLSGNRSGIGAKVILSQGVDEQIQEFFPVRGWCSSSDYALMFGLRKGEAPYKVTVVWPDGKISSAESSENNITISEKRTSGTFDYKKWNEYRPLLAAGERIDFVHRENEFNAFSREALMPHMESTEGPPLAKADINKDGLDDLFVGGAKGQRGEIFIQTIDGKFHRTTQADIERDALAEDVDAVFLDVENDGDQDLIVVSGGQEEMERTSSLEPRLYRNDGRGNFKRDGKAFTNIYLNASCVKPKDYDNDGDLDLFIGASVMPFLYGMSPVSMLLKNDGKGHFTLDPRWLGKSTFDNPTRVRPGLVKDAIWTDLNKDNLPDLILVGEWMPITILVQLENHKFSNVTESFGLQQSHGWWNTIAGDDFDGDGDIDFVVGNLGLNSRITASVDKPLKMYLGDFDSNGSSDHILVYYNGEDSYPFTSRDQLVKQIPPLKKKFLHYKDYRNVKLEDIVTPIQKGNSAEMRVNIFSSVYLNNEGSKFDISLLPTEAQFFPVFGLAIADVNEDGNKDILMVGNLSAVQPEYGAYDAGRGLVLVGDGSGNFESIGPRQSGFIMSGEGRDIEILNQPDQGEVLYVVSRNNDRVLSFKKVK